MDKNWRSAQPDDSQLAPMKSQLPRHRQPRTLIAIVALVVGLFIGLALGELRLRMYGDDVNTSFATAQQEVRRLNDANASLRKELDATVTNSQKTADALAASQKKVNDLEDANRRLLDENRRLQDANKSLNATPDASRKKGAQVTPPK